MSPIDGLLDPLASPEAAVLTSTQSPSREAQPINGGTIGIPEANTTSTQQPLCFPALATVDVRGRGAVRMDALSVGDEVHIGGGAYSPVFMFTHAIKTESEFVRLGLHSGRSLTLTSGHYVYVSGVLRAARTARIGDFVELGDGTKATITDISLVRDVGLYNPQTLHGDIVVDGIRASTYTEAVALSVAHAMLAPIRGLFARLGLSTTILDSGADELARCLPRGNAVVAL